MASNTARAASALFHLDAACPRDEWVVIGMAAKAAGLSFEEFHNWSKTASNYAGERDCLSVWESLDKNGPVTEKTLFASAREQGWPGVKAPLQAANENEAGMPQSMPAKTPSLPDKRIPALSAEEAWARCVPATPEHAYIVRKQGIPDGLRTYPPDAPPLVIAGQNVAGWLAMPCCGIDGVLQTVQFISPEQSGKLNLPGARFGDGFFTVGSLKEPDCLYLVEGIGHAWAVWKATRCPSVVCFSAGRMTDVSRTLRKAFPAARIVVAPDRGKELQAEAIARDIHGEWCELPQEMGQNTDVNDFMLANGVEALAALLSDTKRPAQPELPLIVVFADELPETFTPPDELVEGLITVGAASLVFGDSNSGKTFLVIDMGCAIARGAPWMGRETEPGLVVYLAAENPASVCSRVQAYQQHHGVKVPNFAIVKSPIDLFDGDADTEAVIQALRELERERGQKVRLIIGDTLARMSAGANENAGQDMGLVVKRIDRIRMECNAHFMFIHHSGKSAAQGARGWSGIRAAVDTEVEVIDAPAGRYADITKQRDLDTKGERIGFRLETVELGQTKWGEPATSCIVLPADAAMKTSGKRVSNIAKAILAKLREASDGIQKTELVNRVAQHYDKSGVYRELKNLVDAGQVRESDGIVAIAGVDGADGANQCKSPIGTTG